MKEYIPAKENHRASQASAFSEDTDAQSSSMAPPAMQLFAAPIQREALPEEEELQMKQAPVQREEMPDEELQMKQAPVQREGVEEEELMQGKMAPAQRSAAEASSGSSSSLNPEVQGQMEGALGADFSDVKIHPNSEKAPAVGALAYTQGSDVHFAPGQYNPNSSSGQELLGHELTHVVQQREGRVQPTTSVNGMPVNDNSSLEAEADQMGRNAAQRRKK